MNIEEARKVVWLKSNPRPLGDLLDEGYLTEDRLKWAAQWAYSSKLMQAAQVLLETKAMQKPERETMPEPAPKLSADKALPIDISLDKARATPWPFPPYKGQLMGPLVESKQLSLKDLGYAIENAWNEKVRKAAIALSLVRLEHAVNEPVPSAGFMTVISGGKSYSERQVTRLTLLQGLFFGVALTILIGITVILGFDWAEARSNARPVNEIITTPGGVIAIIIVAGMTIGASWLFNRLLILAVDSLDKKIDEYRIGQEGEDTVAQLILQALDGNWQLFRNINLPGRNKGDLDLVLVGPPGVWVLEVKNYRGEYRNIGDQWEYRHGKNWKTASTNPSLQAFKNAVRLGNFLKADNLKVFVNPVVVWVNEDNRLWVENPATTVWTYSRLADELGNIWQNEKLSKAEREKIVEKLVKLSEQKETS